MHMLVQVSRQPKNGVWVSHGAANDQERCLGSLVYVEWVNVRFCRVAQYAVAWDEVAGVRGGKTEGGEAAGVTWPATGRPGW